MLVILYHSLEPASASVALAIVAIPPLQPIGNVTDIRICTAEPIGQITEINTP